MMAPKCYIETTIRTNKPTPRNTRGVVFVILVSKCVIFPVAKLKLCGHFNIWFPWQLNFLYTSKTQTYIRGAKKC